MYGGRARKDDPVIEVNGTVDEAQAVLGLARSHVEAGSEIDVLLVTLERGLWVLMAEVATRPENRHKLTPGITLVTQGMVDELEARIDDLLGRFEMPAEFVVPGQSIVSALLDVARTVVRRAERLALALVSSPVAPASPGQPGSLVGPYLNRLSDLCWAMARWQDGTHLLSRQTGVPGFAGVPAQSRPDPKD